MASGRRFLSWSLVPRTPCPVLGQGYPQTPQATGSTPLAVTQEDFLVLRSVNTHTEGF